MANDHGGCAYYTWRFRNDSYNKVTFMRFHYWGTCDGEDAGANDVLPGNLAPNGIFGGWAAFTAVTSSPPTFTVTEIERE